MGLYSIKSADRHITISQTRLFPGLLGISGVLGGSIGLILLWYDGSTLTSLDTWMVLGICVCIILGSVYLIFQSSHFKADFDPVQERIRVTFRGLKNISEDTFFYENISSVSIEERSGTEGSIFVPVLDLKSGGKIDIGFGYGVREAIEELVDNLLSDLKAANKSFDLTLENSRKST